MTKLCISYLMLILCPMILLTSADEGEDVKEAEELATFYQKLMVEENPSISASTKYQITIDAAYYKHKLILKALLDKLGQLKMGETTQKFRKMAEKIEGEANEAKIFAKTKNYDEKLAQNCLMKSFMDRILRNGTLREENMEWRIIQEEEFKHTQPFRESESANLEWNKPNCADPKIVQEEIKAFTQSPVLEEMHTSAIAELTRIFGDFHNFINRDGRKFPGIRDLVSLDDEQRVAMYKQIFETKNERVQAIFAMKILFKTADEQLEKLRQKYFSVDFGENNQQIQFDILMAEAQFYAILKVVDLFSMEVEATVFLMFCPIAHFITFLAKKLNDPNEQWRLPYVCFHKTKSDQFKVLQSNMADEHFVFLVRYLMDKNKTQEDQIVKVLRKISGAFMRLRDLMGHHQRLDKLWANPEIRRKLLDQKFFTDKKQLLFHYHGVLNNQSDLSRYQERQNADIMVWMEYYGKKRPDQPGTIQSLMDIMWLFFRTSYEQCLSELESDANAVRYCRINGFVIANLVKKLKTEIFECKNKNSLADPIKAIKLWKDMRQSAFDEGNAQWVEANQNVGPTPMIQDLHFAAINKLLEDKKGEKGDKELSQHFDKFVAGLSDNREQRGNLLQLLKLEQIKKLFESISITFNENEFAEAILNESHPSSNSIGEPSRKSKKSERNRRRKSKGNKNNKGIIDGKEAEQNWPDPNQNEEIKDQNEKERDNNVQKGAMEQNSEIENQKNPAEEQKKKDPKKPESISYLQALMANSEKP